MQDLNCHSVYFLQRNSHIHVPPFKNLASILVHTQYRVVIDTWWGHSKSPVVIIMALIDRRPAFFSGTLLSPPCSNFFFFFYSSTWIIIKPDWTRHEKEGRANLESGMMLIHADYMGKLLQTEIMRRQQREEKDRKSSSGRKKERI